MVKRMMKAAVVSGEKKTEIKELEIPQLKKNEVLVRVLVCGVCASELHDWCAGTGAGSRVFGHEIVGIVEELGSEVIGFDIGERVSVAEVGGFAEYVVVGQERICHVPEGLSDEEAIGEPIGCIVSGLERTTVHLGDKVGILGLGYMGLVALQIIKHMGASYITAIDMRNDALKFAKKFGANEVFIPTQVPQEYRVTDFGRNEGKGFDVMLEVSGSQPGLDLSGELVAVHGLLSIVGYHQGKKREIDMEMWNWKAFSVVNAHERRVEVLMDSIRRGLKLIECGVLDTKSLMTHEFKLKDLDKAFQMLIDKPEGFIKSFIRVNE